MAESTEPTILSDVLKDEFPVAAQLLPSDAVVLLQVRNILRKTGTYTYCEIGSFLGGSLTPFLRDPQCQYILSVDERERQQPDERGMKFDYAGITSQTMINNLISHGFETKKLETFERSIDKLKDAKKKFDLMFIDAEHTDHACFRDFIHGKKFLNENAIIMFHDSDLIHKALRIIQELLVADGSHFKFIKVKDSAMSMIFLGEYADASLWGQFEAESDLESYYARAENTLLDHVVRNRFSFVVKYVLKDIPTGKAY
jgi:hypothetical protein